MRLEDVVEPRAQGIISRRLERIREAIKELPVWAPALRRRQIHELHDRLDEAIEPVQDDRVRGEGIADPDLRREVEHLRRRLDYLYDWKISCRRMEELRDPDLQEVVRKRRIRTKDDLYRLLVELQERRDRAGESQRPPRPIREDPPLKLM